MPVYSIDFQHPRMPMVSCLSVCALSFAAY